MLTTLLQQSAVNIDLLGQAQAQELSGASNTFGEFISGLLRGTMTIAAVLVLLYLVWGAIEWISAGGDSSKIQKARDRIFQAVIGIIVLASTIAIFSLLQQFLGLEIFYIGSPTARVGGAVGGFGSSVSGAAQDAFRGAAGAATNAQNASGGFWNSLLGR